MGVWMAGAVKSAARANAAAAARFNARKFKEYSEYRAESRACGADVEPFDEWMGEITPRERAESRVD